MAYVVTVETVRRTDGTQQVIERLLWRGVLVAVLGLSEWALVNAVGDKGILRLLFDPRIGSSLYGRRTAELFQQTLQQTGAFYSWQKGTALFWGGQYAATGIFSLPGTNGLFSSLYLVADISFVRGWNLKRAFSRGLLLLNLLATQSRSSWIAFAVGMAVYGLLTAGGRLGRPAMGMTRGRRSILLAAIMATSVALVATRFVGLPNLAVQLASPVLAAIDPNVDAYTTQGRLDEVGVSFEELYAHLPLGGGMDYVNEIDFHDEYFRMGIGAGVLGLLGYLGITLGPLLTALHALGSSGDRLLRRAALTYSCLGSMWAVSALGYNHLRNPKDAFLFWLITGWFMGTWQLRRLRGRRGAADRSQQPLGLAC